MTFLKYYIDTHRSDVKICRTYFLKLQMKWTQAPSPVFKFRGYYFWNPIPWYRRIGKRYRPRTRVGQSARVPVKIHEFSTRVAHHPQSNCQTLCNNSEKFVNLPRVTYMLYENIYWYAFEVKFVIFARFTAIQPLLKFKSPRSLYYALTISLDRCSIISIFGVGCSLIKGLHFAKYLFPNEPITRAR